MNKTEIMNKFSRTLNDIGFKLKKHSPEILVTVGVIGGVAGTVLACKATTKLDDILEESKENVNKIHETVEKVEAGEVIECQDKNGTITPYTVEDSKKDLTIVYTQTGLKIAKLYAPAVAVGALSITSILAAHNILRKRNVALAAAYTAVDQSFKEYRGRVVERFGKELDRELKYNIKAKEIEETVVDEKGKEKKVKKTIEVIDPNDPNTYSEYAKFFDAASKCWEKDPEYNLMFLRAQQTYANDLLRSRGHLFLNEVYDMLDIPRTKAGQIVGWVYDKHDPVGDNFVDFGIYETFRPAARDFVNGYEPVILLDFNVDGNVLDLM